MKSNSEKPKKGKQAQGFGATFLKEVGQTNWFGIVGFALCQSWLTLCFFAPQLFPENSSFRVYELSLVVCVLSLIPGIIMARKVEEYAQKRRIIYPLAASASIGTLLVPLSVFNGEVVLPVVMCAAILTGIGSAWLFIAWYRVFCQLKDSIGFILSVAAQSLIIYILTNIFLPPTFSPWVMVLIATLLPVLSAVCLTKAQGNHEITSLTYELKSLTKPQVLAMAKLCIGMFVISFTCEFMRNGYLGGTDLQYYTEDLNLALLILKLVLSAIIVVWISKKMNHLAVLYKASFILIAASILFMPYFDPGFGYSLTNIGAFIFKIVIMLVAFRYCQSFKIAPVLIFSLTRMTWALDLLFAYGLFEVFSYFSVSDEGLLGIVTVSLGLIIFITYLFVMTSKGSNADMMSAGVAKPVNVDDLEQRCEVLAKAGALSKREREVLGLIARGRSAPRIQEELSLSINTVNSHISHIYRKLGVNSRQELLDLIEVSANAQ